MATTTINPTEFLTALDDERKHLMNIAISVSHSSRELALTADIFSERVRSLSVTPAQLQQIEGHLAQLRRNCADAQYMAETTRSQLDSEYLSWHIAHACDDTLRDAQVRLTLADFAYDRASELV